MAQGPSILRSGIAIANKVTRGLNFQAIVMYFRKIDGVFDLAIYDPAIYEVGSGYDPIYSSSISLHAIVDFKGVQVRARDGVLTTTRATITLLDINEVIAATGGLGIGNDDLFMLPDGDSGPILDLTGFVDAGTGNPIATTVMLG